MPVREETEKVEARIVEALKIRYPSEWNRTFVALHYGRTYGWARYHLERLVREKKLRKRAVFVDTVRRILYRWRPPYAVLKEVTAYLKYDARVAGPGKRYEYKIASWVPEEEWREYEQVVKTLWKLIWHFVPETDVKFEEAEPEFGRTNRELTAESPEEAEKMSWEAMQWIYAVRLTPEGSLERCGEALFSDIVNFGLPDLGYGAIRDKGSGWLKSPEEVRRYTWRYLAGPPYK